ncbi:uncharacterized protein TRUGW13939_05874 [Talaromyces rugulosus]|uniref:NmrA-like domain-containing protein n=1 Tax=Talaromyces rugulosus TaxID=121627 RepID=A0A7H8QXQ7_TALRU|nr:uncharacterized protein TRUGW13939_05874 [Talaromyces rugulosus]QKX58747.1 hypothetical protein TRUGW13939_05874 [Talaromyces rugulosus]
MAIKNVVVIGGAGNLGPAIINALAASPHGYSVSVLSRESSTYAPPAGIKLLKTDYTHESLVDTLKGQDAVVSTIGGAAIDAQKKVIDAAIAAGVKRFIPSEFGSDTSNPLALNYFPGWAKKVEVREYLESKQDQIEWTAIFTGLFFDWGIKVGFIGINAADKTARINTKYKDVVFSATNLGDIGAAVAQALSPAIAAKTANQILRVHTVTASQADILAAFEAASGSKYTIQSVDLDAEFAAAQQKLQQGDFSGVGALITRAIVDPLTGNNFEQAGLSNELLELPARGLKETVQALV